MQSNNIACKREVDVVHLLHINSKEVIVIKKIKDWFKPTKIEQPSRWSCPKHGDGGPNIAFYGRDGKKLAACIRCICEAFPMTEIES